jgi:hypothetical protein
MDIHAMGVALIHAERLIYTRTDMTRIIGINRDYVNA